MMGLLLFGECDKNRKRIFVVEPTFMLMITSAGVFDLIWERGYKESGL